MTTKQHLDRCWLTLAMEHQYVEDVPSYIVTRLKTLFQVLNGGFYMF